MKNSEASIGLLSDMIQLAKADQVIKESEYNFLLKMASRLGVEQPQFEELFHQEPQEPQNPQKAVITSHEERIAQFHSLIVLMNIDEEQHHLEIELLRVMGLKIGLKPSMVLRLLEEMSKYPNGMVPFKVLLEISLHENN